MGVGVGEMEKAGGGVEKGRDEGKTGADPTLIRPAVPARGLVEHESIDADAPLKERAAEGLERQGIREGRVRRPAVRRERRAPAESVLGEWVRGLWWRAAHRGLARGASPAGARPAGDSGPWRGPAAPPRSAGGTYRLRGTVAPAALRDPGSPRAAGASAASAPHRR